MTRRGRSGVGRPQGNYLTNYSSYRPATIRLPILIRTDNSFELANEVEVEGGEGEEEGGKTTDRYLDRGSCALPANYQ